MKRLLLPFLLVFPILISCGPKTINGKMDDNVIQCTSDYKYPNSRIAKISFNLSNIIIITKKVKDNPDKLGMMIMGSIQNTGADKFSLNKSNYLIENDNGEIYNIPKEQENQGFFAQNINNEKPDNFMCIYLLEKKIFKNKLYLSFSFPDDPTKIKVRVLIYDPNLSTWDFQSFGPMGKGFGSPSWK